MGLYDRDYYRDSTRGQFSDWFARRGTVWLVGITCGVFLLQLVTLHSPQSVTRWGWFSVDEIARGQVWRLLTPVFLHDPMNLFHVLFNMLVLYWFGAILEGVYGTREFVSFYLVAGLAGGAAEFALRVAGWLPANVISLGASGATTAVAVVFACHFPKRQLYLLLLPVPIPAWVVALGMVVAALAGVTGATEVIVGGGASRTNHAAHLLGALFGLAYWGMQLRVSAALPSFAGRLRPRRQRPRLRLVPPPAESSDGGLTVEPEPVRGPVKSPVAAGTQGRSDEHLEAKADRVLEKMARTGPNSLTTEEQDILRQMSEVLKKRKR